MHVGGSRFFLVCARQQGRRAWRTCVLAVAYTCRALTVSSAVWEPAEAPMPLHHRYYPLSHPLARAIYPALPTTRPSHGIPCAVHVQPFPSGAHCNNSVTGPPNEAPQALLLLRHCRTRPDQ